MTEINDLRRKKDLSELWISPLTFRGWSMWERTYHGQERCPAGSYGAYLISNPNYPTNTLIR